MEPIIECVPNFSEGRHPETIVELPCEIELDMSTRHLSRFNQRVA